MGLHGLLCRGAVVAPENNACILLRSNAGKLQAFAPATRPRKQATERRVMLTNVFQKKYMVLIAGPILRRVGTMFAAFLAAKGAPPEMVGQLLTALGVALGLSLDVALATIARKKAENAGARSMLDALGKTSTDEQVFEGSDR